MVIALFIGVFSAFSSSSLILPGTASLSEEVLAHTETIEKYAEKYEIEDYVAILQAIMMQESGVKRIRIHDLRHSHVSMLIDMGFSAVDIAERVGHESVKITYRYAHMFPNRDTDIANKLNSLRGGAFK